MRCGNIIMVLSIVQKHWFLIGILLAILLAKLQPWIGSKNGLLHPELTVKYIAVSVIFFNSGLSLKTEDLASAIFQLNLHLYIQLFTFVLAPVTMYLVSSILQASPFDKLLLQGLVVLGCMPPPVSSAVILTKAVGGNEAGAIFNSAFGSFLGIIITPIWLLYFVGSSTELSKLSVFLQLSMTVVVPLIFGQIVRSWAHRTITRANIPFGSISSAVLLLIIYTTFCDTFSHDIQLDAVSLFSIVSLIILLQCMLLVLTFYLSTRSVWKFSPSDVVACIFCSTHKSLTLGIPILKVLFSDNPQISVISIPLLVYHPTQILLGGLLVPFVRGWMMESIRKSRSNSINYV